MEASLIFVLCCYIAVVKEMQIILSREERGRQIAEDQDAIQRLRDEAYRVRSQTGQNWYDVTLRESGWVCTCPDHLYRNMKCKHLWAVELSRKLREQVKQSVVIGPVTITECLFCRSSNLKKFGVRRNKSGDIQRFLCGSCRRTFSINLGFERMKHNPQAITTAMQLYFSGESLRNAAKSLRLLGVQVSYQTVYNWIERYVGLMQSYLDQITPQLSDTWRADEMWFKVKGNPKYLYALLDDESRFWIAKLVAGDKFSHEASEWASQLFREGKEIAGKKPKILITDGLKAYHQAFNREFFSFRQRQGVTHIQHAAWKKTNTANAKMERFNGEIRDREKVMRSLKRSDTPILTGYQIFHNYVRPHMALDGQTPAEKAGIKVGGNDKWVTIIQNAAKKASLGDSREG